jgi:transposase
MSVRQKQSKAIRRRYPAEFKTEALHLAEEVGVSGAAERLGLHESQFYTWCKKVRYEASRSETEKELAIEITSLKRQLAKKEKELAILKKAAVYFAKSLK